MVNKIQGKPDITRQRLDLDFVSYKFFLSYDYYYLKKHFIQFFILNKLVKVSTKIILQQNSQPM